MLQQMPYHSGHGGHGGHGGHLSRHRGPMMSSRDGPVGSQLGLPASIMSLFSARPALPYKPPIERKSFMGYQGVGASVALMEDPDDEDADEAPAPPDTRKKRRERLWKQKQDENTAKIEADTEKWDPQEDPHSKDTDPYTTLFVGRLDYEVTEEQLQKAFEQYGTIRKARIVLDNAGNSRGYGFIEFEHKSEQDAAYKYSAGKVIGSRRIIVDKEKGRIVKNWRPRRLGGGLGRTRVGASSQNEPPARKVVAPPPRDDRDRDRGDRDRDYDRRDRRDDVRDYPRRPMDRRDDRRGRDGDRDRDRDRDRPRDSYRGGDRRDHRDRDSYRDRDRDRDRGDRGGGWRDSDRRRPRW
eukprot:TRINITY_DN30761_c1_g1_i1.p2 TRINITY_DN30761_c1_g1~~TRINITY_DN30761_c1_g1_i1.p2  ORF type:complete len:376 (+),score=106.56 TRINITY_DN30761_c1_g1_i1:71-1129(+)